MYSESDLPKTGLFMLKTIKNAYFLEKEFCGSGGI
jgi:hypothetical protein